MLTPKEIRIEKLKRLFDEALARVSNNDKGEIIINWKDSSVSFKFTQWVFVEGSGLTSRDRE